MKRTLTALTCAAALLFSSMAQADDAPVYFVAQVQITDHEAYFQQYGAAVTPMLLDLGVEVLAASPRYNQLEGDWVGNWTVVIKFPSEAIAIEWYNSDAYQENVRPLRLASSSENNLVLVPEFAGLPN